MGFPSFPERVTLIDEFFDRYLLLTEFEVRTVSYGPSFFPLIFALGPYINGKKRGSVTYSTDRENEVSKIFIISLRLTGAGKETSQSEAEGSTATKNAVPKSQKLNLLGC